MANAGRRNWNYIVWHTAADPRNNGEYDTTRADIDRWHKANGWSGIGYHYVVRKDGSIEVGRSLNQIGAHVKGLNSEAIGICFSGHGDLQPLTEKQVTAGIRLTKLLMKIYKIPVTHVIGHREANKFLPPTYHTTKTCPGKLVNMDNIRKLINLMGGG